MKVKVSRVDPIQLGKLLAAVYALLSLVFIPFLLIAAILGDGESGAPGFVMVIIMPILYVVFGFIGGIVGGFFYNVAAGWVGGMELSIETEADCA